MLVFLSWIARGASKEGPTSMLSRQEGLEILIKIATDRRNEMKDRLNAIRIHSRISGRQLSERDVWAVIAALANGDDKVTEAEKTDSRSSV
jgi:hypothetical protein